MRIEIIPDESVTHPKPPEFVAHVKKMVIEQSYVVTIQLDADPKRQQYEFMTDVAFGVLSIYLDTLAGGYDEEGELKEFTNRTEIRLHPETKAEQDTLTKGAVWFPPYPEKSPFIYRILLTPFPVEPNGTGVIVASDGYPPDKDSNET
jgi:hypothetical protein